MSDLFSKLLRGGDYYDWNQDERLEAQRRQARTLAKRNRRNARRTKELAERLNEVEAENGELRLLFGALLHSLLDAKAIDPQTFQGYVRAVDELDGAVDGSLSQDALRQSLDHPTDTGA